MHQQKEEINQLIRELSSFSNNAPASKESGEIVKQSQEDRDHDTHLKLFGNTVGKKSVLSSQ